MSILCLVSFAEGSHSGLVRAPAKRLPDESWVRSSNLLPSARLASNIDSSNAFTSNKTDYKASKNVTETDELVTKLVTNKQLPKNSLESFIEFKKAQGVSPNMIKFYNRTLTKALRSLGNSYDSTSEDIIKYLNAIPGNQYGYANRHASFRALRTFYTYLNEQYGLPYPMKGVPVPFIDNESRMPSIKKSEIEILLASDRLDIRDKALIMLPYASAMRLSEFANINLEDINWETNQIKIRAKGGHIVNAPISFALPYVKAYLNESGLNSGRLWGKSARWNELHARGIEKRLQIIEKIAREVTGNKQLDTNPHVLRRGFARLNKELGIPDTVAMMNGRWKSIKVYNKYGNDFSDLEANKVWDNATNNLFKGNGLPI